jgi:hypothetical protein
VKRALIWLADSPLAGLSPWIVYALVSGPDRLELAAVAALAVAFAFFGAGRLRGKSVKILELFDITFFTLLAIFVAVASDSTKDWLELWSGEIANVALAVFALGSILFRVPFTIQYARDEAPKELWDNPVFIHINYVLTWVWAIAFLIGAASGFYGDAVLEDSDNMWTGWVIQTAALIVAAQFTAWYPRRARVEAQLRAGLTPEEEMPSVYTLLSGLTIWITITGILTLVFDAGPTWLGIAFIVLGAGSNRVLSARDPEQQDTKAQPAT